VVLASLATIESIVGVETGYVVSVKVAVLLPSGTTMLDGQLATGGMSPSTFLRVTVVAAGVGTLKKMVTVIESPPTMPFSATNFGTFTDEIWSAGAARAVVPVKAVTAPASAKTAAIRPSGQRRLDGAGLVRGTGMWKPPSNKKRLTQFLRTTERNGSLL
jgi:hypothetical protein